jgi:type II secretory pathway component PulM
MTARLRKSLAWFAALLVLAAVFAMYTRPDFLVTLANQVWACF